jgi:flagellin-specific chaperone FliS
MPIMHSPRNATAHRQDAAAHGHAAPMGGLDAELVLGAARHIAQARCRNASHVEPLRGHSINCALSMLQALRANLALASGDTMAANLDDICEYMTTQLRKARHPSLGDAPLDEVGELLNEICMAWFAVPHERVDPQGD